VIHRMTGDGDKKLELVTTEAPDGNPVC